MIICRFLSNVFFLLNTIVVKFVFILTFFFRYPCVVSDNIVRRKRIDFSTRFLSELNTLCIAPSLLASSCLKATLKSLYPSSNSFFYLDENLCQMFDIDRKELQQTQRLIEQLFQSCIQEVLPTRTRRCLAPIDTSNVKTTTSPRVK